MKKFVFDLKSQQLRFENVPETADFDLFEMLLYKALFLASVSKTIANPLAYDLPAPDLGLVSPTDSGLADNPDRIALLPADSEFVVPADTERSASSDSRKKSLDNFNLENQNGLNIGFTPNPIAAVNTDISESECLSGTTQTSKKLRSRQGNPALCYPMDANGNTNGNGNGNGGSARQAQAREERKEDTEEKAFIENFTGNKNPNGFCQEPGDVRVIPVCCRGPESTWGPNPQLPEFFEQFETIIIRDDCVEFIEGRPRCSDHLRRFCAERFGSGTTYRNRAFNVRWMYSS